jgi:hypothetical protein
MPIVNAEATAAGRTIARRALFSHACISGPDAIISAALG